jgi:hypothetical protein
MEDNGVGLHPARTGEHELAAGDGRLSPDAPHALIDQYFQRRRPAWSKDAVKKRKHERTLSEWPMMPFISSYDTRVSVRIN